MSDNMPRHIYLCPFGNEFDNVATATMDCKGDMQTHYIKFHFIDDYSSFLEEIKRDVAKISQDIGHFDRKYLPRIGKVISKITDKINEIDEETMTATNDTQGTK